MSFELDPVEPPAWSVELLRLQVEGRTVAAAATIEGEAILGQNGEPPLDIDRDIWNGVGFGNDRSGGLWAIAGELAAAGANEATIVEALRERDESLGWGKYTNRKDREQRYVDTARRQLANVMPRVSLNGTASATAPPPPAQPSAVPSAWPAPLADAAYHGPLGAVVRGIEPYSEADPAALLAHAIAVASGYIGLKMHARAGDMRHPARFFGAIVGDTSKGRKGTSAAPFRQSMLNADEPVRIASGLSSSEGLVHQVRDEVQKWNSKKHQYEVVDPGVDDKRLVIIEGELATLLRRMEREGNAISATLRDAWDTGNLETLVKQNPTRASGAHINIVAHITLEELRQYLYPTEVSSGFANRFLWFAAKRSKYLSRGGNAPARVLETYVEALDCTRLWAKRTGTDLIDWSPEAGARWDDGYEELSTGVMGLYGQATQRAEAQVLRLAVLYALMDCSAVIELEHLEAGLAVWRFCNDSARWIFGDRTGNPTADTIIVALRANGEMTRTQISGLFNRHVKADKLSDALQVLLRYGLAVTEQRGGGAFQGPPTEYWKPR